MTLAASAGRLRSAAASAAAGTAAGAAAAAAAGALGSLVWLAPTDARADGAALDHFEVADRGSRFFAADSLDLEGKLRVATGAVSTYQHALRVFGTKLEGSRTGLVADQLAIHPGAAVTMAPGARFALDVPVVFQGGNDEDLAGVFYPAPRTPVLGDVRLGVDLKIRGPARDAEDGVIVAGGVSVWLPTGSRDDYTSDGYARVGLRVASAARIGPLVGAARVSVVYRRDDLAPFGGVALGSEIGGVAALGWREGALTFGPEVHGTTILRNDVFGSRSSPVEGVLGAHAAATGSLLVGLGFGTALVRGLGAPGVRVLASIEWTPRPGAGGGDRDGDGVPDGGDVCPDVPGSRTGPPESRGCPDAPRDRDGDGVVDGEDACPDLPGIRTNDPMTNGCPDADHDGVPDPVDACPNVAGEPSPIPRFNGCPADADGDAVPDVVDACPDQRGVATRDPTRNGCRPPPPPPDRDKDGIADDDDACPDEPGSTTGDASTNGCPLVRREADRIVTRDPIVFDAQRRAVLAPASEPTVTALAGWLAQHPEAARVRVEAGADERGRLAQDRAQAVVDALVAKGVAQKRLEPRGLDAHTRSDRPRVELRIVLVGS